MQATVASYDEESRTGSVFLDDGTRVSFGAEALAGTGLRLLRPGQRVKLDGPPSAIQRIQILTLE